jgi:hypothetical protein
MADETVLRGIFKVGAGGAWIECSSGLELATVTVLEARITRPQADPDAATALVKSRADDTVRIIGTDTDYVPSDATVDCLVKIEKVDWVTAGFYMVEFHDLTGERELVSGVGGFTVEPTRWPS